MKARITVRDIAKKAEVSHTTVALALRNDRRISTETRQKIQALAKAMGYRPDPLMSLLTNRRWKKISKKSSATIAFIAGSKQLWPDWRRLSIPALKERAEQSGYQIEEFSIDDYPKRGHLNDVLFNRGIRGAIVGPTIESNAELNLDWNRLAGVTFGFTEEAIPIPLVQYNIRQAIFKIMEELRQRHFKKIGLAVLYDRPEQRYEAEKRDAFAGWLSRSDYHPELTPFFDQRGKTENDFCEWIKKYSPDVVFGHDFFMADDIRNHGWKLPDDFAYVALRKNASDTHLAGFLEPAASLAQTAVDWIDLQIRRNECGLDRAGFVQLIAPEWSDGPSLPPVSPKSDIQFSKKTKASFREISFV